MKSGYFQPLTNAYKIAWIWWVILLSFQQVLFYENNLRTNWFQISILVFLVFAFYFLVRQRRFFAAEDALHFSRDFRLGMLKIDFAYMSSVKVTPRTLRFIYIGKEYQFVVLGKSNQLIQNVLKENKVEYTTSALKRSEKV
ncbi:hypothetical protein GHK52_04965 [Lactococcus garvieae]|nr:hypothetical protein [Lactococcus garvieae]